MILFLSLVGLTLAGLYAAMTAVNLHAYRPPPLAISALPKVSVLVPARDEAANIGPLLDAVLASRGVDLDVVILDDGSSDGTADLVRARADPRVRVIDGAPLPPGWIGKQHACWQLSLAARAPLLAFIDADVRLAPDALARLAAQMEQGGMGLVSGFPRLVTGTLGERLVIPQILVLLLGYLPLPIARVARTDARFAAACGQAMMVTREAYDASGGHAAMRNRIHDGIGLARSVRRAGFGTDLCDLTDLATCRMYETWPQVWAGFLKNAREGMATSGALPIWTLLLGGGHVLPFATAVVAVSLGDEPASTASVTAVALVLAARSALAWKTRQGALAVLLHPLGVCVVLAIQWTALIAGPKRLPAVWRGRSYDV